MRVTGFGFRSGLFYLTMVTAFVATPYSNLFFLLLAFLTLAWLSSAWSTPRNLRGVAAKAVAFEPLPAGSEQQLSIELETLRSPGRRRFQIEVVVELAEGARACGQIAVLDGRATLSLRVPPLARGLYEVRGAWIASSYPLGILEARTALAGVDELVVYPVPAERGDPRGGAGGRGAADTLAEVLGETLASQGDLQPAGLRDFTERDELRSVHWRATARRGTLVVREWEGGGGRGLELQLDRRTDAEALELALAQISAVVALAREQKELLVLSSQGLQATYGEGHRPWREALRFLAGAGRLPSDGPAPPQVSPSVVRLPLAGSRTPRRPNTEEARRAG